VAFGPKLTAKKKKNGCFKVIAYEMEIPINNFDLSAAATSSPISFSAPYHPQSSPVHDFPSQAGAHLIILNMLSPAETAVTYAHSEKYKPYSRKSLVSMRYVKT